MGAISGSGCLLFPQPKSSCRCLPAARPPRLHVLFPSTANATRARVQCIRSQSPNSGEDDSKAVLDAFFLGKAFTEALTERVESTVGEFLSVIGQWQAEQQKQVVDFQCNSLKLPVISCNREFTETIEVIRAGGSMERAKKAKEKAAREAVAGQALETKSLSVSSGNGNSISPSGDATEPI